MKLLLAIPAYRCAKQIQRVIEQLAQESSLRSHIDMVMVFDNQSPDDTATCALETVRRLNLETWVQIVRNRENYGLGGTHKLIFTTAQKEGFDYVIVMHGDDQALPSDILKLIPKMKENYDAILGARFAKGSRRINYSLTRTYGNIALNKIYSFVTGKRILDLGSGLNAFKVSRLSSLSLEKFSNDLAFNFDLLLDLIQKKLRIIYVPITWREEDQVSNAKSFKMGKRALKILIEWRAKHEKKPETFSHFGFDILK